MSGTWSNEDFVLRKVSRALDKTYSGFEGAQDPEADETYTDEDINPSELKKDVYTGETYHNSPDIQLPNWAEGVQDFYLGMVVDPDGFKIEMEAEYIAPDVEGDTTHSVKVFKNTKKGQYPASAAGAVPDVGEYFTKYELNGPDEKSGTEIVSMFDMGEDPSLDHPLLFGSGDNGGRVSESQSAVFLAEWTLDRMEGGESNFYGSGVSSLSRGRKDWPGQVDFGWAGENFIHDEDSGHPTGASRLRLKGEGMYDVDVERFEPSGLNLFAEPLEELQKKLEEVFPERDAGYNHWVEGKEPFWYSPSKEVVDGNEENEELTQEEREDILDTLDDIREGL